MVLEKPKVVWPGQLALVCRKDDPRVLQGDLKGFEDSELVAYAMGFSKEEIIWKRVEIEPSEEPKALPTIEHEYQCSNIGAYYFSRVVVRPLDGKMLPKGGLCLQVDGGAAVHGPILSFLPDPEPIDCMKPAPLEKNQHLHRACVFTPEGAWPERQLGFMLPNRSKVAIHLSDVVAEEKVTLEIGIISAYYSTKIGELADPKMGKVGL